MLSAVVVVVSVVVAAVVEAVEVVAAVGVALVLSEYIAVVLVAKCTLTSMELLSSATVWMSDLMVMLVVNCQLYWRLQYWVQLSVCAVS